MDLVKLIKQDKKRKQGKYIARKYYDYKPTNQDLTKDYSFDIVDTNGKIRTINVDKSTTLYINHFKMLVNQKIDYLLSKEPTIKSKLPFEIADIVEMLKDTMLGSALDGTSWLHFYVENNKIDWITVKDSEIIPIFDKYNKNIIEIIRYYDLNKDEIKVENWTLNGVVITILKKTQTNDEYVIQSSIETTHIEEEVVLNNEVIDTNYYNLPFIPFIPFYNNREKQSDLYGIKEIIDFYNDLASGLIDNIYKFQEALTKLKGFSGNEEVLRETSKLVKKFKMVGIPEGGDMEYMTVDIPIEARQYTLELLKEWIYKIGRGYDSDKLGDGNITNIVIKSRYFQLDNKANELENEEKKFFSKFVQSINLYYNSAYDSFIENDRLQLFNISEQLMDCVNAIDLVNNGLLSRQTLISQIPWVTDVKKELKLIEEEAKTIQQNTGQNLTNDSTGQNLTNEGDNSNE